MTRNVMLVIRLVAFVAALLLIAWAWEILDNIWTYNDAGTLAYLLIAALPGLPGLVLLAFAVHGHGPRLSQRLR